MPWIPETARSPARARRLVALLLALAACSARDDAPREPPSGGNSGQAGAEPETRASTGTVDGGSGGAGDDGGGVVGNVGGDGGSGASATTGASGSSAGAGLECASSESECSGECVDLGSSLAHCGACDQPCADDQICARGACISPAPDEPRSDDDCSDVLAHSLTISEVAIYQAGKISLMKAGQAVSDDQRAVDVVAGRDATVRVSVTREPGWVDRVVSARLDLPEATLTSPLFDKKAPNSDSYDGTLASTFNIEVPGELITHDTRYSVRIVECGEATGSVARATFPEAGHEPLGAISAGRLQLRFVPIVANGNTPDTSAARLAKITAYLMSIYPFEAIDTSLGAPMTANRAVAANGAGWAEVLQQLAIRHLQDDAPGDLYYYGLLEPAEDLAAYCPHGCVGGIGYIAEASPNYQHLRVAMGISYADRLTSETAAHELGHAQGRLHAPCGGSADLDRDFPHDGGSIGWWGLEPPNMLYSVNGASDLMGYCPHRWISDYTYQALIERARLLGGALAYRGSNPSGRFRVIVQSRFGAAWGSAPDSAVVAMGEAEAATILDRGGAPLARVTVYRARMGEPGGASIMVPAPEPGWHAIHIDGASLLAFEP